MLLSALLEGALSQKPLRVRGPCGDVTITYPLSANSRKRATAAIKSGQARVARARGRAPSGFEYLWFASSAKGLARTSTLSQSAPSPHPGSPNPVSPAAGTKRTCVGGPHADYAPVPVAATAQRHQPDLSLPPDAAGKRGGATRTAACSRRLAQRCPHCASHTLGVAARRQALSQALTPQRNILKMGVSPPAAASRRSWTLERRHSVSGDVGVRVSFSNALPRERLPATANDDSILCWRAFAGVYIRARRARDVCQRAFATHSAATVMP